MVEPALRARSGLPDGARWLVAADVRTASWAAVLGACLTGTIGVCLGALLNVWGDEAFSLWTTGAGPLESYARAVRFEDQPPLYFLIEGLWRVANETSIAFARLPSAFFAAAAVAVIVLAAHRIAPRMPPVLVALLSGLNPIFIWAAAEMRVYALVLFIAAVLSWSFLDAFIATPTSRRARVVYGVFALAGLYTQYYVGFVLLAHGLVLLAMRPKMLRTFVGLMALVALGFAPFVPVAISDVAASGSFVSRGTLVKAAHEVFDVIFAFMLPHDLDWSGIAKAGGFGLAALLIAGVFGFGRPVLADVCSRAAGLQWAGSIVVFVLLFGAFGVPLDPLRHLMVTAPSSLIVSFTVLSALTRRRALAIAIVSALSLSFAGATLWTNYRPPLAKQGDWERVAALLSTADPAIPIAIFPAESALPLGVYLRRPVVPIPRIMPFALDYVDATTLHSETDVARVLDPLYARSSTLWLVSRDECAGANLTVYDYNCPYLEAYLRRRYRLARTVDFRGSIARLFVRASAAALVASPKKHDAS